MAVTWRTSSTAPSGVTFGSTTTSTEINSNGYNSSTYFYIRFLMAVGHQYSNGSNNIWVRLQIQGKKQSGWTNQSTSVTPGASLTTSYTAGSAVSLTISGTGWTTLATRYAQITEGTSSSTVRARLAVKPGSTTVYCTASMASPIPNYTLSYDSNGGSGSMGDDNVDHGGTITISDCSYTGPGSAAFVKWNTQADGSGTDYNPADTITMLADTVLYAQWDSQSTGFNIFNAASGTVSQVREIWRVQNGTVEQVSAAYHVASGTVTQL